MKNSMYSDETLKQYPYQLHAVLVHEGQAAAGHYWAYIYDSMNEKWLKFNDIAVTCTSWDDLVKESVGGYHNASAYCLMYVQQSNMEPYTEPPTDFPPQSYIEKLPEDLKEFVVQDNKKFAQEMLDWDEAQARKPVTPTGESRNKEGGDGDAKQERAVLKNPSSQTASTQTPIVIKSNLPVQHAEMLVEETRKQLSLVLKLDTTVS